MLRARRTQQTVVAYDESPDAQDDAEHELRDDLRAAIEDNQLTVQFLPNCRSGPSGWSGWKPWRAGSIRSTARSRPRASCASPRRLA